MKNYERKCYEGDHERIKVTSEFVKKNNLKLHRTQKEILEFIKTGENDIFGNYYLDVLIDYLNWANVKQFYTDKYIKEIEIEKKEEPKPIKDIYEAVQDFLDYMVFGWMKALDERGLSAGRTILKIGAWLWLFGRKDLFEITQEDDLYNHHGMPVLIKVCENLMIKVPKECSDFVNKDKVGDE